MSSDPDINTIADRDSMENSNSNTIPHSDSSAADSSSASAPSNSSSAAPKRRYSSDDVSSEFPKSARSSSFDASADSANFVSETDESFFDLLNHFAGLQLPEDPNRREQCPTCPMEFPLSEFAEHVYECIHQLDDAERRALDLLSERVARELADQSQFLPSQQIRNFQSMENSEFSPGEQLSLADSSISVSGSGSGSGSGLGVCLSGLDCKRTDANHFVQLFHPSVACPVCSEQFPVFEINAHLTFCLEMPQTQFSSSSSNNTNSNSNTTANSTAITGNFSSQSVSSSHSSRSQFSSATAGRPAKPRSRLPIRADDSDDEELETQESENLNSAAGADSADVSCQLTVSQASLVASMVLKRNRGLSRLDSKDPSLIEMLDTFKTLGFTAENLAKLKAESQAEAEGQNEPGKQQIHNSNQMSTGDSAVAGQSFEEKSSVGDGMNSALPTIVESENRHENEANQSNIGDL